MLRKLYYKIAALLIRFQVKSLGKDTRLRMKGRIIGGQYVRLGDGVEMEKDYIIAVYPEFGGKKNPVSVSLDGGVWIGSGASFNRKLTVYCAEKVEIGRDVLFGSDILISDNEHGTDPSSPLPYRDQPLKTAPVQIGDRCWVCEGAKILSGTRIGKESIVAAGAVVKGQFPDRCVLAGVPARVIRVWNGEEKKWDKPMRKDAV